MILLNNIFVSIYFAGIFIIYFLVSDINLKILAMTNDQKP